MSDPTIAMKGSNQKIEFIDTSIVKAEPLPKEVSTQEALITNPEDNSKNGIERSNAQKTFVNYSKEPKLRSDGIKKNSYEGQVYALRETLQFLEQAHQKLGFEVKDIKINNHNEKEILICKIDHALDQFAKQLEAKDSSPPIYNDETVALRVKKKINELDDNTEDDLAVHTIDVKVDLIMEYLDKKYNLNYLNNDHVGLGRFVGTLDIGTSISMLHYSMQMLLTCTGLSASGPKEPFIVPGAEDIQIIKKKKPKIKLECSEKPNDNYKGVLRILSNIGGKDLEQEHDEEKHAKGFQGTIVNLGRMPEKIEDDDQNFNVVDMAINHNANPVYSADLREKYKAVSQQHLQMQFNIDGTISVKNLSGDVRNKGVIEKKDKNTRIYQNGELSKLTSKDGFKTLTTDSQVLVGKIKNVQGSGMKIKLLEQSRIEGYSKIKIGKKYFVNFKGHVFPMESQDSHVLFPGKDQIAIDGKKYLISDRRVIEANQKVSRLQGGKALIGNKVLMQLPGRSVTLTNNYDQYIGIFGKEGPGAIELRQTNVGDCYFLAALFALARTPEGQYKLAQNMKLDEHGNNIVAYDKIKYDSRNKPVGFTKVASTKENIEPDRQDLIKIDKNIDLSRMYQTYWGDSGIQHFNPVEGPHWSRVAERAFGKMLEFGEGVIFGETMYQLNQGGYSSEALAHLVGDDRKAVSTVVMDSSKTKNGSDFYNFKRLVTRMAKNPENFCLMVSTNEKPGKPDGIAIGGDRMVVNGNHAHAAALKKKKNNKGEEEIFITIYNPHNTNPDEKEGLLDEEHYKSFDVTLEEFYTHYDRLYIYDMRNLRKAIIADDRAKARQMIHVT